MYLVPTRCYLAMYCIANYSCIAARARLAEFTLYYI